VHGFWRKIAQNTRSEVRKCLLGSTQWPTTFWGSNSPKTSKPAFYKHVLASANGLKTNDVIEDWSHWPAAPSLARRH